MTRMSIKEYAEAVRWRYLRSSKVVKEITEHRKLGYLFYSDVRLLLSQIRPFNFTSKLAFEHPSDHSPANQSSCDYQGNDKPPVDS